MRLLTYLTESNLWPDETIEKIKKDCKPFLKEFGGKMEEGNFLYRGMGHDDEDTMLRVVRKDRKPKDMNPIVHEKLNEYFHKKFGWYPRTEGVFCSTSRNTAASFGKPYMIFPIGEYSYLYNPDVGDILNHDIIKMVNFLIGKSDKDRFEAAWKDYEKKTLANYTNKGLYTYLSVVGGVEVVMKMDKYHAISVLANVPEPTRDTKAPDYIRKKLFS